MFTTEKDKYFNKVNFNPTKTQDKNYKIAI